MLSGIFTGVLIVIFIGICIWAWSGRRKRDFDEAAHLPLEENNREESRREDGHE